eukprot:CAMPEP_0181257412 /NCGR_PEP_ID=MMETSP1096-20121128/50230_1 /TAXON_ID=156174 ORGANISM="Chrysochromulina ericina, Strain CCMP281" /NCGR_SAMPLE_ID=MMETSP1096 /ASSEMBLY_ACC=CAM_ASM_000453 /LENGTH=147 /DNA_ID=CAMNT_0023355727 /DNA_START=1 /DNA_END=444 /DNA_ORIENTATION=+
MPAGVPSPTLPEGASPSGLWRRAAMKATLGSQKDKEKKQLVEAALALGDPSLATATPTTVKLRANERVNQLKSSLMEGSLGAAAFDAEFSKVWPYAQARFGRNTLANVVTSAQLSLRSSTISHPLAMQHATAHGTSGGTSRSLSPMK